MLIGNSDLNDEGDTEINWYILLLSIEMRYLLLLFICQKFAIKINMLHSLYEFTE